MVKIGDAVTKGDLLILGMNSTQDESVPCKAEGEIIGRVNKRISVTVSRKNTEKIEKNRTLVALKIKIFNFSINIFKKYGNLPEGCDIIEENPNNDIIQVEKTTESTNNNSGYKLTLNSTGVTLQLRDYISQRNLVTSFPNYLLLNMRNKKPSKAIGKMSIFDIFSNYLY